jgi:ubiquinone/menaquinone biosynthesis C-methylase UbiE
VASPATVQKQYDGFAGFYDLLWGGYVRRTLPLLMDAARTTPGERVLDLGSGTGAFEERLAETVPGAEVVGVDVAPAMVERARRKLQGVPAVSFERADAHALPFEAERFDAVVTASTFHYFDRPAAALAEAARVVRPGGRLVVLDWCRDFWTCRVMDAVLQRLDPAHDACYTLAEMRALLGASPLAFQRARRHRAGGLWGMMTVEAFRPA